MKNRFLILLAVVGFSLASCGSNTSDDGSLDSDRVDTSMSAPTTDTASLGNGATDTATNTTTMPVDSAQ